MSQPDGHLAGAARAGDVGIKVTLVEPMAYSTDWLGPSSVHAEPIAAYDPSRQAARQWTLGDPQATGSAILDLVDAERPPLRVFFGNGTLAMIKEEYVRRIAEWEQWNDVSLRAHGAVAA